MKFDLKLLNELSEQKREAWHKARPFRPSLSLRLIMRLAPRIQVGAFHLILPDGVIHSFRGPYVGPEAICVIHNDRFARQTLIRGSLGFCESYLARDWTSPDMTALFEVIQRNENALNEFIDGRDWWRRLEGFINLFRINTKSGSRRNIAHHYDLGNSFYSQWLDESMTYSAGIYVESSSSEAGLRQAQNEKYARIAKLLDLKPEHHVLEIGCGWGGFAEFAAQKYGCRITGLTLSQEQFTYAVERMARLGLKDRVEIKLCDYRDVRGEYDRVASIEMFEAVGQKYWSKYFSVIHDRLKPGGVAAMQVITIADRYFKGYEKGSDYIQKYIFPGGMLPTFTHLCDLIKSTNLLWSEASRFGEHYAQTLAVWRQRFLARWPHIKTLGFDEKFRRMWEQYLCYCEAGFNAGAIDVYQFSFVKPLRVNAERKIDSEP